MICIYLQSSSRSAPIRDIFYFQNTPEVTSVQHIIPFSLTVSLTISCTEPVKPLVLHTPLNLSLSHYITLHYSVVCPSVCLSVCYQTWEHDVLKRMNWFRFKLAQVVSGAGAWSGGTSGQWGRGMKRWLQVVSGARAWSGQLLEVKRSRSRDAKVRFGILTQAAFSTPSVD